MSILSLYSLALTFFAVSLTEGQFTVRVETSLCENAGTDDDIYIDVTVFDGNSPKNNTNKVVTISEKLAKIFYDDFERGSDDVYELTSLRGDNILQICSVSVRVKPAEFLRIKVRPPGDWRPRFIELAHEKSVIASYNISEKRCNDKKTWIHSGEWRRNSFELDMVQRAVQCPERMYSIRVRTSDCDRAGTDDGINLKLALLKNTAENTGEQKTLQKDYYSAKLDQFPRNDFERGSDQIYRLNNLDRREIVCSGHIEISKDPWRLGIFRGGLWRPHTIELVLAGKVIATYDESHSNCAKNGTWYRSGDIIPLQMLDKDNRCPEETLM